MREGWRETTLGEVVEVNPESMSTSSAPATFRYVDLSSVTPTSGIDEIELASYSLETAPGRARRIIRRGDVLVSTVRPYLRGFGYVSSSLDGEVASTGFCVLRAIPAIIESGLIWALVRTPDFVGHLMTRATGSNYPAVRSPDVASFPILLPPLDEQRRIVDLVAAVDEAIEAAERERNAVGTALGTLIARFCFSDCTNSNTTQLKKVSKIVMGQSPPGDLCNKAGDGTPLLNGPTEFTDEVVGEPRQWTNSGTKFAETGDILICVRGATAGRLNEAAYPAAIGRGLAAVQAESKLDTAFVRFALLGRADQLLPAAGGTIFPNISGPALGGFELSWPADAIRIEVAQLLLEVERVKREATQASVTLRTLRSALLADLLSGDHEIPASYDALLSA